MGAARARKQKCVNAARTASCNNDRITLAAALPALKPRDVLRTGRAAWSQIGFELESRRLYSPYTSYTLFGLALVLFSEVYVSGMTALMQQAVLQSVG